MSHYLQMKVTVLQQKNQRRLHWNTRLLQQNHDRLQQRLG
jgi:hypothetical protein